MGTRFGTTTGWTLMTWSGRRSRRPSNLAGRFWPAGFVTEFTGFDVGRLWPMQPIPACTISTTRTKNSTGCPSAGRSTLARGVAHPTAVACPLQIVSPALSKLPLVVLLPVGHRYRGRPIRRVRHVHVRRRVRGARRCRVRTHFLVFRGLDG